MSSAKSVCGNQPTSICDKCPASLNCGAYLLWVNNKIPGCKRRNKWNTAGKEGCRFYGDEKYLGVYMDSKLNVSIAESLVVLKTSGTIEDWEYEPEKFTLSGERGGLYRYIPDFKIRLSNPRIFDLPVNEKLNAKGERLDHIFLEGKGGVDKQMLTKMKAYDKYARENHKPALWVATSGDFNKWMPFESYLRYIKLKHG